MAGTWGNGTGMRIVSELEPKMPGLAQRDDKFSDGSSPIYTLSSSPNAFWSKHRDNVSYNQLQKVLELIVFY